MKKYIINSLLFLGILALIGSCNTSEKRVEEEVIEDKITSIIEITKEQFENSKMEIGSVSIQNFNESIKNFKGLPYRSLTIHNSKSKLIINNSKPK